MVTPASNCKISDVVAEVGAVNSGGNRYVVAGGTGDDALPSETGAAVADEAGGDAFRGVIGAVPADETGDDALCGEAGDDVLVEPCRLANSGEVNDAAANSSRVAAVHAVNHALAATDSNQGTKLVCDGQYSDQGSKLPK